MTEALDRWLNEDCHCISVDPARVRAALGASKARDVIDERAPHFFATEPVFVGRAQVDAIQGVIQAVEALARVPAYQEACLRRAPEIAKLAFGPSGAFYGYDFHLGADGPKLIEVNTNAGGGLLNAALMTGYRDCCSIVAEQLVAAGAPGHREAFAAMFETEWRSQRDDRPLKSVAIVDFAPAEQYMYPEFLLFQELFEERGIRAFVADPSELRWRTGGLWIGDQPIDLVYNRLTDFYFEHQPDLREAYISGAVVVTPHPRGHALLADKRNMALMRDPGLLAALSPRDQEALRCGVPHTETVRAEMGDALWARRKQLFFKPAAGFGSRAAYRGAKLSKKKWAEILDDGPYVAQELVPPSERTIRLDDEDIPLKLDIRAYTYAGQIQLLAARLYRGQTTNFRTPGGGFAAVFTTP